MDLSFASLTGEFKVTLKGALYYAHEPRHIFGNILRLDNLLGSMEGADQHLPGAAGKPRIQLENAKLEVDKPFPRRTS